MKNVWTAFATLLAGVAPVGGEMVVERWGIAGPVQHAGALVYEVHGEAGRLMRFDLSALPQQAKVYRARLFFRRGARYGSGFDIVAVRRTGEKGKLDFKPVGGPLPLAGPHWRWFEATGAVRAWLSAGGKGPLLLLLRKAPAFDLKATYLEIAYEGRLRDRPGQVGGVKAFYRNGQVFVSFREIEDYAARLMAARPADKDRLTWGELDSRFKGVGYEGTIPNDDESELRYRVYRHSAPITPASIGQAELVGEAVPGSVYNTRLVPGGDFIKQRPEAVAGRLAIEPGKPLPHGSGLFVHTCARNGNHHYAVVTSLNGVENTVQLGKDNVAGPVSQGRAPPQPVLQSEQLTDLRRGKYHTQWYSYWAIPPQCPRPTRYDFVVGFTPETMTHPAPLTFTRGHTWGPGPELTGRGGDRGIAMSMNTDPGNGLWTGMNDARDTLKGIEQGAWKPFTHHRQEALIRWAQSKWEIDEQRIVGSIGAWGMWEIRRADLYAYIHGWGLPEVTKGFQCWNWARGAWGPPAVYKDKPSDANPFHLQDYTRWVLDHPDKELPYFHIHAGWGMHLFEMGWPPMPRFVRAMMDTKRAFCLHSRAVDEAMAAGIIQIRRDASVPAFGNCSLDDNIGEGDPRTGVTGWNCQINGYLVWESDTIVDEPGSYEITVLLWNSAPLPECTVDLTPRRCRAFRPKGGARFEWRNVTLDSGRQVQAGTAEADEHGLVTVRGLRVGKRKHRIVIRPKE